jgi:hypothetical protein
VPARSWDAPRARTAAMVDHAGRSPRSGCISLRKRESLACSILAPPAGFEPAHTAPECNPAYGRYRNTTCAASSGRVWGAAYPPAGTTFGLLVVLYQRAVGGRCRRVALERPAIGAHGAELGVSLRVQARDLMIMVLSTARDHRGVPCLPSHHACWSRSGWSSSR